MYCRSRSSAPRLQGQSKNQVQSLRIRWIRRSNPNGVMDFVRWRYLLGSSLRCPGLAAYDSSNPKRCRWSEDLGHSPKGHKRAAECHSPGDRRYTEPFGIGTSDGEALAIVDLETEIVVLAGLSTSGFWTFTHPDFAWPRASRRRGAARARTARLRQALRASRRQERGRSRPRVRRSG